MVYLEMSYNEARQEGIFMLNGSRPLWGNVKSDGLGRLF